MQEYILCAATWYKDIPLKKVFADNVLPKNCDRGLVFCGHRHTHCLYTKSSVTGLKDCESGEYIQGFLTSKNRFVNREEAAKIAFEFGQLEEPKKELYSEDLY